MRKLHPKWYCFGAIAALGLVVLLFCPGYQFSGLFFLGISLLVPLFHLISLLRDQKLRKGLLMTLRILLALFFAAVVITGAVIVRSSRGTENPKSDYLIVLGAGVNGSVPSRSLRERIDAAYDYLTAHPDSVAIVSGGQGSGEDITEAACMYNELTKMGIPAERIWMEPQATSTLENLQYSLDLIGEKTGQRPGQAAIVSSEYHLHRAGIFAGWLDLEAELVPARTTLPLLRWNYYLREVFAVWYYSIFGG